MHLGRVFNRTAEESAGTSADTVTKQQTHMIPNSLLLSNFLDPIPLLLPFLPPRFFFIADGHTNVSCNRSVAFSMALGDLLVDGAPLPYDAARRLFKADPSKRFVFAKLSEPWTHMLGFLWNNCYLQQGPILSI